MGAAGQGSLAFSPKEVTIPIPGPPFAANSADNGLSVDPVTGRIVLGNDVGAFLAALLSDREIPIDGFSIAMKTATGQIGFDLNNGGRQGINIEEDSAIALFAPGISISDLNPLFQLDYSLHLDNFGRIVHSGEAIGTPVYDFLLFDPVNGALFLGDTSVVGNGTNISIDDGQRQIALQDSSGSGYKGLGLDFSNRRFSLGDPNQGNLTALNVDDLLQVIDAGDTSGQMLILDRLIQNYSIGDLNQADNGLRFILADSTGVATILSSLGKMLELDQSINSYKIGDIDLNNNGSQLFIDDANQRTTISDILGEMLALDGLIRLCQIGDISSVGNGTFLNIDDNGNTFQFANAANNAIISMNGLAGFTGTVAAPATISVEGGIVTNVA